MKKTKPLYFILVLLAMTAILLSASPESWLGRLTMILSSAAIVLDIVLFVLERKSDGKA